MKSKLIILCIMCLIAGFAGGIIFSEYIIYSKCKFSYSRQDVNPKYLSNNGAIENNIPSGN